MLQKEPTLRASANEVLEDMPLQVIHNLKDWKWDKQIRAKLCSVPIERKISEEFISIDDISTEEEDFQLEY